MGIKEIQLLILFCQLGMIDSFSVLKLCLNCGSQYIGLVLSSAGGNFTQLGATALFEPIYGIGTSYQYVQAAATLAERNQRIATLASFFAASVGALTTDPVINASMGATIAGKIAYMKVILAQRGGFTSWIIDEYFLIPLLKDFALTTFHEFSITIKTPKTPVVLSFLSPAQIEFQEKGKLIAQNIFQEHTARRYGQGLTQKVVKPTLQPPTYTKPFIFLASTKINIFNLIGWSCLGIGISVIVIYGTLIIIRDSKKKHYQIMCQSTEQIIDG